MNNTKLHCAMIWLSRPHVMFATTASAGKSDVIKHCLDALNAGSK